VTQLTPADPDVAAVIIGGRFVGLCATHRAEVQEVSV
jgi:hypothetical protein